MRDVVELWQHLLDGLAAQPAVTFLVGILTAVLGFLSPRIWDLFKRRLERWVNRPSLERVFPEPSERKRLAAFLDCLLLDLDQLDEQARWEHNRFVPLDAEINVLQGDRKRRRVMDLFAGIRAYPRARLFLVIGDPGSGKSVALRRLARDLLTQSVRRRRIPLYVNLRDWSPGGEAWSQHPPSEQDFREFLLHNVKSRVPVAFHAFLDQWLLKLLDRDRLFLILDSFDELPAVMDARDEADALVRRLSDVIARTAYGGGAGRAILASRPFRRPRFSEEDRGSHPRLRRNTPVFELRPFSDVKIASAIDKASKTPDQPLRDPEAVKRVLFRQRPDLASIARTPFMLGLMIDYWVTRPGAMPASQAELFESFVKRRLARVEEAAHEAGLDDEAVLACAAAIAESMFEPQLEPGFESQSKPGRFGLDMPLRALVEELPSLPIEGAVAVLREAHIGRPGQSATFSFIHRRFHEYFLIDRFRRHPDHLPLQSIPNDGRWRDALVLFCEVADEPVAEEVARYCWAQVNVARPESGPAGSEASRRRALHSLRFLADAFRARRQATASFQAELADRIEKDVSGPDMLVAKHALEAAGLLNYEAAQRVIVTALESPNAWLIDTAFRACRYLPAPSWKLKFLVMDRLLGIPPVQHLKTYNEIMLSLRSIEGMGVGVWLYRLRRWDIRLFLFVMPLVILMIQPFMLLFVAGVAVCAYIGSHGRTDNMLMGRIFSPKKALPVTYLQPVRRFVDPITCATGLMVFPAISVLDKVAYLNTGVSFMAIMYGAQVDSSSLLEISAIDIIYGRLTTGTFWFFSAAAVSTIALVLRPLAATLGAARISGVIIYINADLWRRGYWKKCITSFATTGIFIALLILAFNLEPIRDHSADNILLLVLTHLVKIAILIVAISLFTMGCIGIVILPYWAWLSVCLPRRDALRLKRAMRMVPTREAIHAGFLGFANERYGLKYVRWLEANCERPPEGPWPEGHPPNVNNDRASIELAKLDERWLGLDR